MGAQMFCVPISELGGVSLIFLIYFFYIFLYFLVFWRAVVFVIGGEKFGGKK